MLCTVVILTAAVLLCRLVFTVVSDPPEDEGDCVDVAYASVDFVQVGILVCEQGWLNWERLAQITNDELEKYRLNS